MHCNTCSKSEFHDCDDIACLYSQATSGNQQAENRLITLITPSLRKQLQRLIWETNDREDILQEALMACLIKIRKGAIKAPEVLIAYACSIGKNIAYRYIKTSIRDQQRIQTYQPEQHNQLTGDKNHQPDICLEQSQTGRFIQRQISKLNQPRDQQVLNQYYFEEQESKNLCQQHGLQNDHLYRVMSRARQRLGKLILPEIKDYTEYSAG